MTKPKNQIIADKTDIFAKTTMTDEERAALAAWKPLKETIDLIEQQVVRTDETLSVKRAVLKPVFEEYVGLVEQKLKEMSILISCLDLLARYMEQLKNCYQRLLEAENSSPQKLNVKVDFEEVVCARKA